MSRRRAVSSLAFAFAAVLAASLGGCGYNEAVDEIKEGQLFQQKIFKTPVWAQSSGQTKMAELEPHGPVPSGDLVNAAGQCAPKTPPVAQAAPAPQPVAGQAAEQPAAQPAALSPAAARAKAEVGSIAGDLASAPMPQGPPPAPPPPKHHGGVSIRPANDMDRLQPAGMSGMPPVSGAALLGGIALGMTECQAVRRAGQPTHVNIVVGDKGQRKVVLTYLSGSWPGIYTFQSGRLKVVDAAPDQRQPAKPKKRHSKRVSSRSHGGGGEDIYVR